MERAEENQEVFDFLDESETVPFQFGSTEGIKFDYYETNWNFG